MRMMALTTGIVSMSANGAVYSYDYGIPADHKADAATAWTDYTNSDPIEDLRVGKEKILDDTGEVI